MGEQENVAAEFEENRQRLWTVAYRLLGSTADAEDAVQETWLRLTTVDRDSIRNLPGWLTTVLSRISLNVLRGRSAHGETPLEEAVELPGALELDEHVELAETLGLALVTVLGELSPAERIAFVLHDVFAVPFGEIAVILDRTPDASRQLASRARRRVRESPRRAGDPVESRRVVDAFLAAARGGDLDALVRLLDADVVLTSEPRAAASGAPSLLVGVDDVSAMFNGRAQAARPASVDGRAGAAWSQRDRIRMVFDFTIDDGRISRIHLVADPAQLDVLHLALLDA